MLIPMLFQLDLYTGRTGHMAHANTPPGALKT